MAFANNEDLIQYVHDIFDHGTEDWSGEITLAEGDVINQIKINYYNLKHNRSTFNETLLTDSQWTKATVYRALSAYILPKLSTYRVEDTFAEQMAFYKDQYADEINVQFQLGIEYDYNEDATIQDSEVETFTQTRLYR